MQLGCASNAGELESCSLRGMRSVNNHKGHVGNSLRMVADARSLIRPISSLSLSLSPPLCFQSTPGSPFRCSPLRCAFPFASDHNIWLGILFSSYSLLMRSRRWFEDSQRSGKLHIAIRRSKVA